MKIDRKTGAVIAGAVFIVLLIAGLTLNHLTAKKKGRDSFFHFEVPQKSKTK